MKKFIIIFLILSFNFFNAQEPWKRPTAKGYYYRDESILPKQKILIFSYGSLVQQKDNKKTGDMLYAGGFVRTSITVPVSFTFLAGYPSPTRRATITIDTDSHDYKPLWVALSDFSYLENARNNLAAREGAPLLSEKKGYDLSYVFYIKKVAHSYKLKKREKRITGHSQWVTFYTSKNQQLPTSILQKIIDILESQQAVAGVWVALPSNVDQKALLAFTQDPVFVKNTSQYIQKLPPGNILTPFEQSVLSKK